MWETIINKELDCLYNYEATKHVDCYVVVVCTVMLQLHFVDTQCAAHIK